MNHYIAHLSNDQCGQWVSCTFTASISSSSTSQTPQVQRLLHELCLLLVLPLTGTLSAEILCARPPLNYPGTAAQFHFFIPSHSDSMLANVLPITLLHFLILTWVMWRCLNGFKSSYFTGLSTTQPLKTHPTSAMLSCCLKCTLAAHFEDRELSMHLISISIKAWKHFIYDSYVMLCFFF